MKKITLGEFEDVCSAALKDGLKIEFDVEEQDWFEPFTSPLYRFKFDKATVWPNPKRAMFSGSGANMTLMFVDSIYRLDDGDTYNICCVTNIRKNYKIKMIKKHKKHLTNSFCRVIIPS